MKAQPLPQGVLRISNEGLGNCLFIAVAQSVEAAIQQQRQIDLCCCCEALAKASRSIFHVVGQLWPDGSKCGKETIDGFDEYIGKVAQVGAWAGNLEVAALTTTMDRPIFVLHETGQVYSFCPQGSHRDIFPLLYSKKEGHFEALSASSKAALRIRAKPTTGITKGGRGFHRGGGKTGADSVGGYTALGGLTVSFGNVGGRTAPCRKQNFAAPGSAMSSQSLGTSKDVDSLAPSVFVSSSTMGSGNTATGKRVPKTIWTCPYVSWSFIRAMQRHH